MKSNCLFFFYGSCFWQPTKSLPTLPFAQVPCFNFFFFRVQARLFGVPHTRPLSPASTSPPAVPLQSPGSLSLAAAHWCRAWSRSFSPFTGSATSCWISFCSHSQVATAPEGQGNGVRHGTSQAVSDQRTHAALTAPDESHVVRGAGEQRGAHAHQVWHAQWLSGPGVGHRAWGLLQLGGLGLGGEVGDRIQKLGSALSLCLPAGHAVAAGQASSGPIPPGGLGHEKLRSCRMMAASFCRKPCIFSAAAAAAFSAPRVGHPTTSHRPSAAGGEILLVWSEPQDCVALTQVALWGDGWS